MKNLIFILGIFLLIHCNLTAQDVILDQNKYSDCLLVIPIDYKDIEENYKESMKYAGTEIIIIVTNSKGKIKSEIRGFIKNWEKSDKKGVFFEPISSNKSDQKTAEFPLFNAKNTYCFEAECYDKK